MSSAQIDVPPDSFIDTIRNATDFLLFNVTSLTTRATNGLALYNLPSHLVPFFGQTETQFLSY